MDITGPVDLLVHGVHDVLSEPGSGFAPRIVPPARAGRDADGLVVVVEDPTDEHCEGTCREVFHRAGRGLYLMAVPRPDKRRAAVVHGATVAVGHHLPAERIRASLRRVARWPRGVTPPALEKHGVQLGLTPRAVDVAVRITRGWSNAEIADDLHLSINTVKTYIRQVYRVLGVESRVEASYWYRRGPTPEPTDSRAAGLTPLR